MLNSIQPRAYVWYASGTFTRDPLDSNTANRSVDAPPRSSPTVSPLASTIR